MDLEQYHREAEQWLIKLSKDGPPNMESYGSIINELNALIRFKERSRLPAPSGSPEAGSSTATPWEAAPRRAITAPQTGTSRGSESHFPVGGLDLTHARTADPEVARRKNGFPGPVVLPPLCISKQYKPATDTAKEVHKIITTFNQYANSLEFVGQLGETEAARKLLIFTSIPLFIFADFVQEAQLPLKEAAQFLESAQASEESLSFDLGPRLHQLEDAVAAMRQRSGDWSEQMEDHLLAAVKQGNENLIEKSASFVGRNSENWKILVQSTAAVTLLSNIVQSGVMNHSYTALVSGATLAWASANVIGAAGEVAPLREKKKENCQGKAEEYSMPALNQFVKDFTDLLRTMTTDARRSKAVIDVGTSWNKIINEVRNAYAVLSRRRQETKPDFKVNAINDVLTTWRLREGERSAGRV